MNLLATETPWRFTLLGYQLGFAHPWYLSALLVAGILGSVAIAFALTRRARVQRAIPYRFLAVLAPGLSVGLPAVQSSFYALALLCFAFALGQPQCGSRSELTQRRGIDVVVAIDASKSMLARDIAPSRLERAKLELTTLLDELKGDRVAVIAFAGDAFIQCPLTGDYAAAKMFLRAIDPDAMPQGGTNIGAALLLSRQVLDSADRGAKEKVVVLISDGEDLEGEITEGVDALKEGGAQVLAVGIGSETGEPIPVLNKRDEIVGYTKDDNGTTVMTRLDRAGLERIADATGGKFFYQPKSVAMGEVVALIDKLQKNELESRLTVQYAEMFQPFVLAGLLALAFAYLVVPSWRRK